MSMDIDFELNADRLREECGVFGIYGHPDAAALTALGLHALHVRTAAADANPTEAPSCRTPTMPHLKN